MVAGGGAVEMELSQRLLEFAKKEKGKSWQEISNESGLFGNTDPGTFNMKEVGSSSPVIEYVIRPHINILCI